MLQLFRQPRPWVLDVVQAAANRFLASSPHSHALQSTTALPPAIDHSASFIKAPSVHPPTTGSPLVVRYPFPIEYYKNREALVYNLSKHPVSVQELDGQVFNVPVRVDILHRVVRFLRAKWQQGTHKAKTRGEGSGGGRKPWPQKGTGRARHGSIRSPIWKGGGASHGPVPRSHAHKLYKNVQLLGFKCALSAKCNEGRLVVVESLVPDIPKTKLMKHHLQTLMAGCYGSTALLVDTGPSGNDGGALLRRAAGNLEWVDIKGVDDVTVYHLLKYQILIMTAPALQQLTQQLLQPTGSRASNPIKAAWWAQQQQGFKQAANEILASL